MSTPSRQKQPRKADQNRAGQVTPGLPHTARTQEDLRLWISSQITGPILASNTEQHAVAGAICQASTQKQHRLTSEDLPLLP